MRLSEVRGLSRSRDKAFKGKKNNIVVFVKWLDTIQIWYYLMIHSNGKRYSSLWEDIKFNDFDDCEKRLRITAKRFRKVIVKKKSVIVFSHFKNNKRKISVNKEKAVRNAL